MVKGIKMEYAKKNDCGDKLFHISKLSRADNGNLHCRYCGVAVQYISAHTRHSSGTRVSEYLKLWRDAEHMDGCSYSVEKAVELLVASAEAVENDTSIFEQLVDGTYLFRMNLIVDAQKTVESITCSAGKTNHGKSELRRNNYVVSGKQLASYFRSAAGVAKLRALILDTEDVERLSELIKIQYKDKFISWNDFYYDDSRYLILFNRLTKGRIDHPVAVNLSIKERLKANKNAKYFPVHCQGYSQTVKKGGDKLVFIPKVQLADSTFGEGIEEDDSLLVVGNVWPNTITEESSIFRGFNVSVYHKSQIKREMDGA